MSIPTLEPIPKVGAQDRLHLWAEETKRWLERNIVGLVMTPGAISLGNGDNNNVDTKNLILVQIKGPTAAFAVTGLGGGSGGRLLILYNTTAQSCTLKNENASSSANNRILTFGGDTLIDTAILVYSDVSSRWLLLAVN